MDGLNRSAPIEIIVHYPTTDEGKKELARRVSEVHADFVCAKLKAMDCPTKQKLELLNTVVAAKKM